MTHKGSNASFAATKTDHVLHTARARSTWARVTSYFSSAPVSYEAAGAHNNDPMQQPQQQVYPGMPSAYASSSPASPTPVPPPSNPAAGTNPLQSPHANCFNQAANTVATNATNALELIRTYHMYVRMQKTRWRSLVLFLLALIFYSHCTFRGPQERSQDGFDRLYGGGMDSSSRASGGSAGGTMGIGPGGPGVAGGMAGSGADGSVVVDGDGSFETFARPAETRRRYFQPPWLLCVLIGCNRFPGKMEMDEVEWWPPSNRTNDSSDPNGERGLNVGTPNAASLSVARSQPPWSADTRTGLAAFFSRATDLVSSIFFTPDPPSYEQALNAFFRTRQATTEGSCNRCQMHMIEQEVRAERMQYRQFLRENKLRVPMLLYYNRLPVYAMLQHLRLMRVRNYQLLDYVSRADAVLRRPETVANDVVNDAALHARELDFELTRLSFVFYLQRLHLRALRHADAMRLETFHFLRHLSSTVPTLRQLWTGQDHCKWPGVSCVVVRVPLNLLIDDDHPAVQAFVEDLFSVCRGPDCRQRRCIPPACGAYTQHLTRRLFTSTAPGYWMRWNRLDDTAAMDEMIFEKAAPRKSARAEAAAAAASQQQQLNSAAASGFGSSRRTFPVGSTVQQMNGGGMAGGDNLVPRAGGPTAYKAARASRTTTRSSRTVWTEQQFAHDHPNLLLSDPLLLVDVDVAAIMEEIVRPATSPAEAAKAVTGNFADSSEIQRDNIERPLIEDLLSMQEKLLHTIAAAAPRGLQFGKQRRSSPTLTIPFTFVTLNLANMGLRGYLPDFYDTESTYDLMEAATSAASRRSGSTNEGLANTLGNTNSNINNNGRGAKAGDDDERASLRFTSCPVAGAASAAGRGGWAEVSIHKPRSDVYWGRLSRQRMLESRNLTTSRLRRSATTVNTIASEVQRVLRRVEKIGMRNHHEDLAAYFSEVSTLAQFQNERWSAYRWPEAMVTVTNDVAQTAVRRLYPIVEDNAFSTVFAAAPVYNVDHHVELFGEINPRLVALLSIDISGNPLLSHLFPRTWLSVPFLQSVRTCGSSVLAKPLRTRVRTYNQSYYCPLSSGTDERNSYTKSTQRQQQQVPTDAVRDKATMASASAISVHDRDLIGAVLLPPFAKIDAAFSANDVEALFQQADPISPQRNLYRSLQAAFDDGFVEGIRQLLTPQQVGVK